MATIPLQEPAIHGDSGPVFFAAGFRPFFLFAGLQALVALPLWLAVYVGGIDLNLPFGAALWHGHEMVFGFAGAAIGGFLLTAVPNWTNSRPVGGRPLILLFSLWLAGRVAVTLAGYLPSWVVAGVDLSFLPTLAWLAGKPLIEAGKLRNAVFLVVLALFFAANAVFHILAASPMGDPMLGIDLGLTMVLVLITLVGGRIVPSFTQNWLRMQGQMADVTPITWIEKGGAVGALLVAMILAMVWPGSVAAGLALLAAAIVHALRLVGWQGYKTWSNPILWVLHLGYLWLVIGLALMGLSCFIEVLPASAALHALTAGCVGTMIMAVMTRASLGHSGRTLAVSKAIVLAYGLLSLGTLLRVVAPMTEDLQMALTHMGGTVWSLAWVLFVVVYWPVLTKPRLDGRPG